MKTSTIVLIVLGLGIVGVGVYFVVRKKKTATTTVTPPAKAPQSSLQTFEQDALGFGFNEGKKLLSGLFS